jgi:DUF2917 family protein
MKGGAMNLKLSRAELRLEPRQVVGLLDAAGAQVRCRRGKLWITQHRDGRDLVVAAGGGVTLDRPGLALIHALEPAEVALEDSVPEPGRIERVERAARGALRAIGRWIARTFGPEAVDRYHPGPWHRYL